METKKKFLAFAGGCELQKQFEELYRLRKREFDVVYSKSQYHGSVLIFDLRIEALRNLGIPAPEEAVDDLFVMLQYCIEAREQMNTLLLCDNAGSCRFYSNNQICRLLNGDSVRKAENLGWLQVFHGATVIPKVPEEARSNFGLVEWHHQHGNGFACLELKTIPESYSEYGDKINGVENYLPKLMFFLMEGIRKGDYPWIEYPPLYKPAENVLKGVPNKILFWHYSPEGTEWLKREIKYIPPSYRHSPR